jgi:hypothetical protein
MISADAARFCGSALAREICEHIFVVGLRAQARSHKRRFRPSDQPERRHRPSCRRHSAKRVVLCADQKNKPAEAGLSVSAKLLLRLFFLAVLSRRGFFLS